MLVNRFKVSSSISYRMQEGTTKQSFMFGNPAIKIALL